MWYFDQKMCGILTTKCGILTQKYICDILSKECGVMTKNACGVLIITLSGNN